ncbi:TIGR04190 family B12-binding domain/radical SAM domain protein [bacterium]|nr:TIGR04190 family B12-binding domain/radical SAM domain protein [bacterium]
MMRHADLVLLHPPSIYDFRKRSVMFGPVSDLIPSTPIFEMYPIGFVVLSEYLGKYGYQVRIINVALKMLKGKRYDPEKEIGELNPMAFGIDLHWMPHCHGSIALAEICKRRHPKIPVIFGGLSSSYFHKDLIDNYPDIDYVLRGDSTERPLLQLMDYIRTGDGDLAQIPNLTWRDKDGKTRVNPLTNVLSDLNGFIVDFSYVMKKVMRYRDLKGYTPYANWLEYPATAVLNVRGCTHNCKICGGSSYFFKKSVNRQKPAYRDPGLLADEIGKISKNMNTPIMIIGDILQGGKGYGVDLLNALKKKRIKNPVGFEFFVPPPDDILEMIADAIPHFNIEMSPESHDEGIRRFFGRPYGNEELERMLDTALRLGCDRIDLFFIIGVPRQDYKSVIDTVEYCDRLYKRFAHTKRLLLFISPYAPFIDPGSEAYENPEKFGYRIYCKTVEEHRKAMEQPSWKHILSYETEWMTRDEIVESSYEAALKLNQMRMDYGLVCERKGLKTQKRIIRARETIKEIDRIMAIKDKHEREGLLLALRSKVRDLNENTICDKKDLEWPVRFIRMSVWWVIRNWWHIEIEHRLERWKALITKKPVRVSHLLEKEGEK